MKANWSTTAWRICAGPAAGPRLSRVRSPTPRSGCESLNGHGADRDTRLGGLVAVNRQLGTAPAGKTGTASPQGETSTHMLTKAS